MKIVPPIGIPMHLLEKGFFIEFAGRPFIEDMLVGGIKHLHADRQIGMLPAQDSGAERAMRTGFNAVTKIRREIANRR